MSRAMGQNSLGRTKLTNSLGKLALDQDVHLETTAILCDSRPHVKQLLKSGNVNFLLEKAFIIQEKRLIIRHKHIKEETLNILCPQAHNLAPKNGSTLSATRTSIAIATRQVGKLLCHLQQIYRSRVKSNPDILKLSIRRRQSNLSTVFIFVTCEEKDFHCVVSVVQLGLTAARTASTAFIRVKQITFSHRFFLFLSRGKTKHLIIGPSGNSEFCFPRPRGALGNLRPRPHVSGYFRIRNFFFPDTATVHTHPATSTANQEKNKSALQSGKK